MSDQPKLDGAELLEIYKLATLIKQNDARVIKELMAGRLLTPYYSPRGQEIIPAALSRHLRDDDYVATIYRGTHDMLAKGFPLGPMWAELAGRVTGTCKGKGGTMHLTYPPKGVMLTTGVVGSAMPIANGLAWASTLNGDGRVTIANFGDGAANIGAFHESLNLASLWKLPVVFVCQNNQFGEHTTFANATSVDTIAERASAYGMAGVRVDGNDPDVMWDAAKTAVDRARAGEGPTLLEAVTYRFNGHILGEDMQYMDQEQYKRYEEADPVPALRARLIAEGSASEEQLAAIEAEIDAEISAAVKAAQGADYPDPVELKRDIYAHELA